MEELVFNFLYSPVICVLLVLIFISYFLIKLINSPVINKVFYDWSTDAVGRHVFNNGSRIIALSFIFLLTLITSFEVSLNPFHVKPLPLSDMALVAWLTYIGAESFNAYLRTKKTLPLPNNTTVEVKSETTNISTPPVTNTPPIVQEPTEVPDNKL